MVRVVVEHTDEHMTQQTLDMSMADFLRDYLPTISAEDVIGIQAAEENL